MSASDVLAGLSLVNAGLQCTNQYISDKKENNPYALNNLFFNASGSIARIGIADHMARHGNFWGYTLNSFVPYTNPAANAYAMGTLAMPFGGWGIPFGGWGMPWGCRWHHHHCGPSYSSTHISIRC